MASSKKNKNTTPQDQALAAKRVEFVKAHPDLAPVEARTRFFVQTRAAELQAKGVEVTKQKRQELRQKFASGDVQRTGFYTPADIARAAARNAGTGSTGGTTTPTGGTSTGSSVGSGQNLSEYKMLDKENMARRPVAPKKNNGFDEQSMNPMEFFKSPLVRGVVSAAKWTGRTAKDAGESLAASSINPVLNIPQGAMANIRDIKQEGIKRFFWPKGGKNYEQAKANPNFREAGVGEKVMNIAPIDVGASLAIKGAKSVGARFVESHLAGGVARAAEEIAASRMARITGGSVVKGADKYVAEATAGYANAAKTGTVDLITGAYQDVAKNVAKSTAKKAATKKATSQVVRGAEDYVATAVKGYAGAAKTGTVDLITGAYKDVAKNVAKSTAKKTAAKPAAKKAATKSYTRMRDVAFDLANGNAAEKKAAGKVAAELKAAEKKVTPAKSVAPKATKAKVTPAKSTAAPKAAKKEVNRFADAWDDSPIDMSNVDFGSMEMRSTQNYSTARRATKVKADVSPAPAPASAPKPKTTAPKARAKAGFKAKVNEVKATPAPATVGKSSFGSQAEYSTWLKSGGKETLRNMSQAERDSFMTANAKWVKGAGKQAESAAATQSKTVQRQLAAQRRYQGARPELQAKFNQALLNRQQRQLLAKISKKK